MSNNKVENFTINGKCSSCGNCCTDFLAISNNEKIKIREFMRGRTIKEQSSAPSPLSGLTIDLTCPFRDEKNQKCLIYKVRPAICRTFICTLSEKEIKENKDFYSSKNEIVSMRDEFFGNDLNKKIIQMLGRDMNAI